MNEHQLNTEYSMIIITLENSIIGKDSEGLNIKNGDTSIKVRREVYLKLDQAHCFRLSKSSMTFIFHRSQKTWLYGLTDEIRKQGGQACMFDIVNDLRCIKTCIEEQLQESINTLETILHKARGQVRKLKRIDQFTHYLQKLYCFYNFLSKEQIAQIDQLVLQSNEVLGDYDKPYIYEVTIKNVLDYKKRVENEV